MDAERKLAVGFYTPSQRFKDMPEMTAVFFEDNMQLVATVGPSHDPESEEYAQLFAAAPELAAAKADLLKALVAAEIQLQYTWLSEASNMRPYNAEVARSNPLVFARIKDQNGLDVFPTAAALVTVRAAIQKHGAK